MLSVVKKSFRDSRWFIFWLSVGLVIYLAQVLAVYPSIKEQQADLDELLATYPDEAMGMLYGGNTGSDFSIADPAAYMQSQFMTWVVLIVGGMMTAQAFKVITNAERNGKMDAMLSLPIARRELLLGHLITNTITVLVVLSACVLSAIGLAAAIPEFDLAAGDIALGIYGAFFIIMAQISIAYMLASLVPSRWKWAGAVAYVSFFSAYLLNGFKGSVEILDTLSPLFMFNYYSAVETMTNGVNVSNWLVLIAVMVFSCGLAWWGIDRKEMGV